MSVADPSSALGIEIDESEVVIFGIRLPRFRYDEPRLVNESTESAFEPLPQSVNALRLMAAGVLHSKSILIEGPVSCGKSFLVRQLAELVGRRRSPQLTTLQLGEHMDGRALIGAYQCSEIPGQFEWIPGPLTNALNEGHWLLLEDLNCAPADALSSLVSVVESRSIYLPGRGTITAHPDFRLFGTMRTNDGNFRHDKQFIYNQNWLLVTMQAFDDGEVTRIIRCRFSSIESIAVRLLEAFRTITTVETIGRDRPASFRDMVKWCRRIAPLCSSTIDPVLVFQEALDCFASYIRKEDEKKNKLLALSEKVNINKETVDFYLRFHKPAVQLKGDFMTVGRAVLPRRKATKQFRSQRIALTRPTCVLLEQLAVCVQLNEPVLLVGETGCGKTSAVQFLAQQTGTKLHVVNMNQQSENSDLTGGFKPANLEHIAKELKERYVELFGKTFSAEKNQKFLFHIQNCLLSSRWNDLTQLIRHTATKAMKSAAAPLNVEWLSLAQDLSKFEKIANHASEGLMFSYVEGVLIKAMKNGEWILLDEINLASAEAIDCLHTLLDDQCRDYISFGHLNSNEPLKIHKNFRLFACMNPSGDVGKKELPFGIRNRFTEFFVLEPETPEDLAEIIHTYLADLSIKKETTDQIIAFYISAKTSSKTLNTDALGHGPCYSLRTLCRALAYARSNPYDNVIRSLYEAFCLSFLTELDSQSYRKMETMIQKFIINKKPNFISNFINQPIAQPGENYVKAEGYWIKCGNEKQIVDERYVLTSTVRQNLRDLARAVAARTYPVLLQGETSVGKTSLITYLAKLSGNKCVRINNHEHTDVQEYIGTYTVDENNKLKFIEGPLVTAMRNGEWIILDELNLCPPDILEALNRVLDDNRELFIPETQETVQAHPDFILFATQNPAGIYGGRKVLSRAFRNRFIQLHFNELPFAELEQILQHRCCLPASYAKKMVMVMHDLQMYRSTSGVFVGRESYMTLRDLFRWGERYRLEASVPNKFYDWERYLTDQGYLLLGGRSRRDEDEAVIRAALEKHFSRRIEPEYLFSLTSQYLTLDLSTISKEFQHMVWTFAARRLAILVGQALRFSEPLLLVGETGCGKTTICQLFADLQEKELRIINCHMMTEASDFLGRLVPAPLEKTEAGILFEWRDGPLVNAMVSGSPLLIDEISLADDSVLERLNSLLEPERSLLLTEKGVGNDGMNTQIHAASEFSLMATMNPGGDYGKKELSRALRNRFTEIWCSNILDGKDFVNIVAHNMRKDISLTEKQIGGSDVGECMLQFVRWFSTHCPSELRRFISVRDIMDWVKFINKCSNLMDAKLAYLHGAFATVIDGLGGNCSSGESHLIEETKLNCANYLLRQMLTLQNSPTSIEGRSKTILGIQVEDNFYTAESLFGDTAEMISTDFSFGMPPFMINCGDKSLNKSAESYSFNTLSTRRNLFRLLRSMQLEKPTLLEGSPGVGKTSLIEVLAKATGHPLTRINLSEQTDLSDLFGCDLPVVSETGEQRFAWMDGVLLSAVRKGHWILIDEMNLASQSVLEGLNACFDHRGEIFIPEIDRTFKIDRNTCRFFACQNPFSQGGSRKGLPKSFLNRFSVVVFEPMTSQDQRAILSRLFQSIEYQLIEKMVELNEKVNDNVCIRKLWGQSGSPWEFNLRDLLRWCELITSEGRHPLHFIDFIYAARFRSVVDRSKLYELCNDVFLGESMLESSLQMHVGDNCVQIGDVVLERDRLMDKKFPIKLKLLRCMLNPLRHLMQCVKRSYLAILVGQSGIGKTTLIKTLAALCGKRLRVYYLTSDSDASELLGSFEQIVVDTSMETMRQKIVEICSTDVRFAALSQLQDENEFVLKLASLKNDCSDNAFMSLIQQLQIEFMNLMETRKKMQFAWIDSPLVEALKAGDWIVLKNVNYCNPAVLDRLNALLEPGGVLTVTERGLVNGSTPAYRAHENFRLFYTMNPAFGSISRPMRNRGVEICVLEEESWITDSHDLPHVLQTEMCNDYAAQKLSEEILAKPRDASSLHARDILRLGFTTKINSLCQPVEEIVIDGPIPCNSCVPVKLMVNNCLEATVLRDSAYLNQCINEFPKNSERIIFAAKQFLLLSSRNDFEKRAQLVKKCERSNALDWCVSALSLAPIDCFGSVGQSYPHDFPYDARWNGELARHMIWSELLNLESITPMLNRWIFFSNCKFVFDLCLADLSPHSLMGTSTQKLERKGVDLPQAVKALPELITSLKGLFNDSIVANSGVTAEKFDENVVFFSRLHVFLRTITSKIIDWTTDNALVRLYWLWLYSELKNVLSGVSISWKTILSGICDFLNKHWKPESEAVKLYELAMGHFVQPALAYTEEQLKFKTILEGWLFSLNAARTDAIIFGDRAREVECLLAEKDIGNSSLNGTCNSDAVNEQLCHLKNSDDGERKIFSRRDIFMRKLALLINAKYVDQFDILTSLLGKSAVLPFRASFSIDLVSRSWSTFAWLTELLQHCLLPVRSDDIFEETIKFKVQHLTTISSESAVVSSFMSQHMRNGFLQTPMVELDKFVMESGYIKSFLWRFNSIVDRLDNKLKETITHLLNSVSEALRATFSSSQDSSNSLLTTVFGAFDLLKTSNIDEDFFEISSEFGICLCLLTTPPVNCIDPVIKNRAKAQWLNEQNDFVNLELEAINGQYESVTGRDLIVNDQVTVDLVHPHVHALLQLKLQLVGKSQLLPKTDGFRPKISQFDFIGRKFREFIEMTRQVVQNVRRGVSTRFHLTNKDLQKVLASAQNWLNSAEQFKLSIDESYFAYSDVTLPFMSGLSLIQLAMNHWSLVLIRQVHEQSQDMPKALPLLKLLLRSSKDALSEIKPSTLSASNTFSVVACVLDDAQNRKRGKEDVVSLLTVFLDQWTHTNLQREKTGLFYEYKPKALLSVEEQEELDMDELFGRERVSADGQKISRTKASSEDDRPFALAAKLFLETPQESENAFSWTLYETTLRLRESLVHWRTAIDKELSSLDIIALNKIDEMFSPNKQEDSIINVYKESSVAESASLRQLLENLIGGAEKLLMEWPENSALQLIRDQARKALGTPASTPVIKMTMMLEKLILDAEQWESVAAKHVKLDAYLQPMRALLLKWKKLEVVCWEKLLDDVDIAFSEQGCISTLQFASVVLSWLRDGLDNDTVVAASSQLFEQCPIGEFEWRVRLTRTFLRLWLFSYGENKLKATTLTKLENFASYFSRYITMIIEKTKKLREPIEKQLKDFLKIFKFQDLNIFSIQASAAKAHRQLFRIVKQYKEILREPVRIHATVLSVTSNDWSILPMKSVPDHHSRGKRNFTIDESVSTEILSNASSYYIRCAKLVTKLSAPHNADETTKNNEINQLVEAAEEMSEVIKSTVNYTGDDEEKIKLHKRSLIFRQKKLSNFFRTLRSAGFSYRKGAALDEKQLNEACFALSLEESFSDDKQSVDCESELKSARARSTSTYWSCISQKLEFDTARMKPNAQLETGASQRCVGFAQNVIRLLKEGQQQLESMRQPVEEMMRLATAIKEIISNLNMPEKVNQKEVPLICDLLNETTIDCCLAARKTEQIWSCCPDAKYSNYWKIADSSCNLDEDLSPLNKYSRNDADHTAAMEQLRLLVKVYEDCQQRYRLIDNERKRAAGFVSKAVFDRLIAVVEDVLRTTSDVQNLLKCCGEEENVHSQWLLRIRDGLTALDRQYRSKALLYLPSEQLDRQVVVNDAERILKSLLLMVQASYKLEDSDSDRSINQNLRLRIDSLSYATLQQVNSDILVFLKNVCTFDEKTVSNILRFLEAILDLISPLIYDQYLSLLHYVEPLKEFYSITINAWSLLFKRGYLDPIPQEGGDGDGEFDFNDLENAGMGQGEGMNDVSDQITDLGQVEGLKNEEDKGQRELGDVPEKPIEMEDDFNAEMEDVNDDEDKESDREDDEDKEKEPDMDWQKGENEKPQEEQLDPKIWDMPEDPNEQPPLDDSTEGANEKESQLAAKEQTFDDEVTDERAPNEQEQQEQNEENPDFDLENLNLDDIMDSDDESVSGRSDDQKPEEQTLSDLDDGKEEELEENEIVEEEAAQIEKEEITQSTLGHGGEATAENESAGNDPVDKSTQQKEEEKERKGSNKNDKTEQDTEAQADVPEDAGQMAQSFGDSVKRFQQHDRRDEQMDGESDQQQPAPKRRKISEEGKTAGQKDEVVLEDVDVQEIDDVADNNENKEQPKEPAEAYAHGSDVGPDAAQISDSASLEAAQKQSPDLKELAREKQPQREETENDDERNQSGKRDLDGIAKPNKSEQSVEKKNPEEMEVDEMPVEHRDIPSAFYTATDFYTKASKVDFEELLKKSMSDSSDLTNAGLSDEIKAKWFQYVSATQALSLELTETLRLVLEPTVASKLQGDYRTGKRLNIRKLIPYIASHFRKNKIWLRRTKKAKRDYQILLAIDDSTSMQENKTKELAFESLALLSASLRQLEIGRLGVCKFGESTSLLHSFNEPFTEISGQHIINRLNFDQKKTNIAQMMEFTTSYFARENFGSGDRQKDGLPAQLLVIISDGRGIFAEGKERVQMAVQTASRLNVFIVFIILDDPATKDSILDIRVPIFHGESGAGSLEIRPYLEFFPFPFYIILRRVVSLPAVLGEALRQWFEIVVAQS